MTDRDKVYTKVKKTIKQMLKLDHQGQVVTMAMMISGIVMSRKAQLSAMSSEVPGQTKDQSIEMRMRRWVKDDLDVEAVYMPFARQILEALSHMPLVLVMDGSQAGRGCMVLMIGVVYQKRALPIAWLVYKGKKGHASAERHIQALEKVMPLPPKDSQVILLGDAEYDTTEMLAWIEKNTSWQYVLRISPQIYVQKSRGFHIHKSHLADPMRLSRLLIAACLAYIWMITQGLRVIVEGNLSLIDRTDRRDKSLFRLGLDCIKYALKHSLDFQPTFHFLPLETIIHVR